MSARPLALAVAVALTGALAAVFLLFTAERDAGAGLVTTIDIVNFDYCDAGGSGCDNPYEVQVEPGSSVTWRWGADGGGTSIQHTVTECTDATFSNCPGANFDEGPQTSGSFNFPVDSGGKSTYYFRCNIHTAAMRGIITVGDPATPTASPTASPTPSPTASPTPSPTPSATASPTESPSPAASPDGGGRSDVNCDGQTNADDVLALLASSAGISPAGQDCPPLGSDEGGEIKGDLDCDGLIGGADALIALRVWAGLPAEVCA